MSDAARFWNPRFADADYVYGTEPNAFLREHAHRLPAGGRVLSLGEGEGRNAVFLARQGWQVTGVDASSAGLAKVARLAQTHAVRVDTIEADLEQWEIPEARWDGIVSVFCHLPPALRQRVLRQAVRGLRPGGVLLLTGYTPRQPAFGSGGPKEIALLNEPADLIADLAGLVIERCEESVRDIREGRLHTGRAAVVEVVACRPAAPLRNS